MLCQPKASPLTPIPFARARHNSLTSEVSLLPLIIGEKTIPAPAPGACLGRGDFNHDCRVNLVDFSILIYWFGRSNPPAAVDLSSDGEVDVVDFSILMYYWTG